MSFAVSGSRDLSLEPYSAKGLSPHSATDLYEPLLNHCFCASGAK